MGKKEQILWFKVILDDIIRWAENVKTSQIESKRVKTSQNESTQIKTSQNDIKWVKISQN